MIFFILLLLSACASEIPILPRGALLNQLLSPRPGHKGLTNQTCTKYEKGICKKMDVVDYDLSDDQIRQSLRDVKVVCNVAGRRFRICKDRPGLCTNCEKVKRFLGFITGREVYECEYIPMDTGYQRLINSRTLCAAQESPLGRSLFMVDDKPISN